MKRTVIRLGVAGTLAALSVAALGIPAQAAVTSPAKPGISTQAAALRSIAAPPAVEVSGTPQINGYLWINDGSGMLATKDPWSTKGTKKTYQWYRNGVAVPGATTRYYTPQPTDVGKRFSYKVTGTAPGYKPVTRISDTTVPIMDRTPPPVLSVRAPAKPAVVVPPPTDGPPPAPGPLPSAEPDAPRTVGTVLTGELFESWKTSKPVTMKYQWLRNGLPIPGATALEYTVTAKDLNKAIVLRTKGINGGKVIGSVDTHKIVPSRLKTLTPITMYSTPLVQGQSLVGLPRLGRDRGWTQKGVKLSYQWLRNGTPIKGATSDTYTPVDADAGKYVTLTVTASLKGWASTTLSSGSQETKTNPGPGRTAAPKITGKAVVGSVLTAKKGTWRMPVNAAFKWQRNGVPIKGATGSTYKLTAADKGKKITVVSTTIYPGTVRTGIVMASNPVTVR